MFIHVCFGLPFIPNLLVTQRAGHPGQNRNLFFWGVHRINLKGTKKPFEMFFGDVDGTPYLQPTREKSQTNHV